MSTGLEAVGEAVTGGAMARAVEPRHGEGQGEAPHGACLNCEVALIGSYCHQCGQNAHVHRTLAAFGHDFLHGVFHFEGKIWRTLPDLVIRPGRLTRDYIAGKRARYVSPLALFLFCVFLMFAVLGWTSSIPSDVPIKRGDARAALTELDKEIAGLEARRSVAAKTRANAAAAGKPVAALDKQIATLDEELSEARTGRNVTVQATAGYEVGPLNGINIETRSAWLDQRLREAAADPKLVIYKLKANAYKFAWAIIPLSLPFVALLFINRRRFGLYDHAVFVTYSLCAMSLLLVLGSVLGAIGVSTAYLFALVPLHFFVQLRGAYALTIGSALWRTVALMIVALAVMMLFAVLLIALGIY
jgi:hypothetical protein